MDSISEQVAQRFITTLDEWFNPQTAQQQRFFQNIKEEGYSI